MKRSEARLTAKSFKYRITFMDDIGAVQEQKQTDNFDIAYHMYNNLVENAEWVWLEKQIGIGLWDKLAVRHYNYAIAKSKSITTIIERM